MASVVALLLLLPFFMFSETLARAPPPQEPTINITDILVQGGQFNTFLRLLNETRMMNQLQIQLDSNSQGMTIFAPTDNGFQSLKPGAINSLNDQQKTQFLLYHVLTKFYTLIELETVSNPARTLAGDWGLNFTGQANQVNVSTGVVTVQINNKVRELSPLSVFAVDQVLLPEALFGHHHTAPPSKTLAPTSADHKSPSDGGKTTPSSDDANSPSADGPNSPSDQKDAAVRNGVGLSLVLGFGLIAMSVL